MGRLSLSHYLPGVGKRIQVGSDEIADQGVDTADITNGAVTHVKLADDAVETHNIKDKNVTTGKVADNAVTGVKMSLTGTGEPNSPTAAVTVDHAVGGGVAELLAADANNDRLVVVTAYASEAAAGGPEFDVGSAGDTDALFDDLAAGAWALGDRYIGVCIVPATENLRCTVNAAGTAGTVIFSVVAVTPLVRRAQIAADAIDATKLADNAVQTEHITDGHVTGVKLSDKAVSYLDKAAAVAVDHAAGGGFVDLLVADPNNDRLVLVQAIATETAAGDPEFDVGPEAATNALFDDLAVGAWAKGERYEGICVVPATRKLQCIINAAGTAGAFSMRVVVLTPLVQRAQLAADAVNNSKLADDAVQTENILNAAVTAAKLANGAGVAALLVAGLGNSVVQVYADSPTKNVLALDAAKARAVLVVAVCLVKPAGTLNHATFSVGYPAALDAFLTVAQMEAANVGTVLISAGLLPINKTLDVTITNGGDVDADDDGSFAVTVLALPTS